MILTSLQINLLWHIIACTELGRNTAVQSCGRSYWTPLNTIAVAGMWQINVTFIRPSTATAVALTTGKLDCCLYCWSQIHAMHTVWLSLSCSSYSRWQQHQCGYRRCYSKSCEMADESFASSQKRPVDMTEDELMNAFYVSCFHCFLSRGCYSQRCYDM